MVIEIPADLRQTITSFTNPQKADENQQRMDAFKLDRLEESMNRLFDAMKKDEPAP